MNRTYPRARARDAATCEHTLQTTLEVCSTRPCRRQWRTLANANPWVQYQTQKHIQNTIRVPASLYTMNVEALESYQYPLQHDQVIDSFGTPYIVPPGVYWNQMSDRAQPSHSTYAVATGSTYHSSSTKHTITSSRPGAQGPRNHGTDIKHNSYHRYLNKLKGNKLLRRGLVPPTFGRPIVYNPAFPIHGNKTVKTAIVQSCPPCIRTQEAKTVTKANWLFDTTVPPTLALDIPAYTFSIGDIVLTPQGKGRIQSQINNQQQYVVALLDNADNADNARTITVARCDLQIFVRECPNPARTPHHIYDACTTTTT